MCEPFGAVSQLRFFDFGNGRLCPHYIDEFDFDFLSCGRIHTLDLFMSVPAVHLSSYLARPPPPCVNFSPPPSTDLT